ncbi:hypothetical protein ANCCAN_11748 [Ancylostoma caninum]|uniref:Protein kinase domain-containing protein n=1 Tax=Ancylostoma caninum TaxID=29170 RepID=A0A368GD46_ANCCA|nr:hypothetical protein ANCCAN_11748 [Ancylostoma caninum]
MAELYMLRPLFPGTSELDQLFKIVTIMGTPNKDEWPEGYQLATAMNFRFPQAPPTPMETIVNTIGKDGMKLMMDMMMWNPEKRPSASQSLKYKYFQVNEKLGAPVMSQPAPGSVRKTSAGSTQSDTKAICAKQKIVAKEYPGSENVSPQGKPIERHLNRNIPLNKSNLFDKLDESTTKLEKIDAAKNKSNEKKPAKEIYLSKSRFIPGAIPKEGGGNNSLAVGGNAPSAKNRSAVQARFEYAYALIIDIYVLNCSLFRLIDAKTGYVPNFGARTLNNNALNKQQNSGRIDWTAKYVRN